jgi:hypothetical protein
MWVPFQWDLLQEVGALSMFHHRYLRLSCCRYGAPMNIKQLSLSPEHTILKTVIKYLEKDVSGALSMFHHSIYSHLVGGKAPKWKKSSAALLHHGTQHFKSI